MKILFLVVFVSTLLTGCSSAEAEFSFMSTMEAYELITSGADVIILDVRSEMEFLNGHIANAVLLPVGEIENRAEDMLLDKDAIILVICQSGNRSLTASQVLADLGFTNVYDIGGMMSWPGEVVQ